MAGSLVPSDTSSNGFRQTGIVNWVDFTSKTVDFTIGDLTRYSKAGIDPATVAMGQAVCKSFNLSLKVKKKVLDQISALPQVSMYGRMVRFGFGPIACPPASCRARLRHNLYFSLRLPY
jgi:hypothetical protein